MTSLENPGNSPHLDPLDARIAELERELHALRSQKLQMSPAPVVIPQTLESVFSPDAPGAFTQGFGPPLDLSTMPPPVAGSQISAARSSLEAARRAPNSLSGAQVVLALGGAVLAAAAISFGAFIWPRLTTTMRVLVLSLVVAALGAAAVFVKRKLNALAESLAVGAAASLLVLLLLWHNARVGSLDDPAGIGVLLFIYALTTGVASLLSKLKSWEYISSGSATLSFLILCNSEIDPYLVAGVGAILLGALAWRLVWQHLLWGSGLLFALSLVLASNHLGDLSVFVPRELPFALLLVVAALTYNRSSRVPVELRQSVRYIGVGFAALSGLVASLSTLSAVLDPSATTRVGAVLILVSGAFFSNKVPQLRVVTKPLLLLVLVAATSGMAVVWLCVALLAAYMLRPTDVGVVTFAVAMACTSTGGETAGLISGGSPTWFVLALSSVLPFVFVLKTKVVELSLLGGALTSGAVLVATDGSPTEPRTLLVSLVLALSWALAKWLKPAFVTTWWLAPAVSLSLSCSTSYAVDSVGGDTLWRTAVVAGVAALLVAAGVKWKLGGLLVPGFAALCLVVVARVLDVTAEIPVWIPLVGAAIALLVAGARFEYLEAKGRRTLAWTRELR